MNQPGLKFTLSSSPCLTRRRCSDCSRVVADPDPRDKEPLSHRCRILELDEALEILRDSQRQPFPPEIARASLDRIFGDGLGEISSSRITQALAAEPPTIGLFRALLSLGVFATLCGLLLLAVASTR